MTMKNEAQIRAKADDLCELIEALDSHVYWQLSDPQYRDSGFVIDPGSNDPEMRRRIRRCARLEKVLREALGRVVQP